MGKKTKKSYSAKLKFQIVLEALTSDKVELPRFGGEFRAWVSSQ